MERQRHCSGGATCLASDQWRPAAGGNLKSKGEQKSFVPICSHTFDSVSMKRRHRFSFYQNM